MWGRDREGKGMGRELALGLYSPVGDGGRDYGKLGGKMRYIREMRR